MKLTILLIAISFLIMVIPIHSSDYTFVSLPQDRGAACLDGTPTGLYIHQPQSSTTLDSQRNFMIYFNGGGFCGNGNLSQTLQSCYKRSFTSLGSTANCTQKMNFDNQGLLSTLPQNNPVFHDWIKIYAIYCDGSEHHGTRQAPISYKDRKLHFRGTNNSLEQLRYIEQKYDIYNKADKVVVTGVSAGGIATYFWSNYMYERSVNAKILAIPDSGLFLTDYKSPIWDKKILRQRAEVLLKLTLEENVYPIEACVNQFDQDYLQCYNAANMAKFLKTPMLIIDSIYDSWPLLNILGITCHQNKHPPYAIQTCNQTVRKAIDDYADSARNALKQMIKDKPSPTGVWSPACIQHGFTDSSSFTDDEHYKVPTDHGITIVEAIERFLADPKNPPIAIDQVEWPLNKGCNGIGNEFLKKYSSKSKLAKELQVEVVVGKEIQVDKSNRNKKEKKKLNQDKNMNEGQIEKIKQLSFELRQE